MASAVFHDCCLKADNGIAVPGSIGSYESDMAALRLRVEGSPWATVDSEGAQAEEGLTRGKMGLCLQVPSPRAAAWNYYPDYQHRHVVGVVSAPRASSHLALEVSPGQGIRTGVVGMNLTVAPRGRENMSGVFTHCLGPRVLERHCRPGGEPYGLPTS